MWRVESTPEGAVHHWLEVPDVTEKALSFRWTAALDESAFTVVDVRDAAGAHDGNEIFIATR